MITVVLQALLGFFIANSVSADSSLLQCFNRTAGRGVSNSEPLAELWHVTPYDCLHWCLKTAGNKGERCLSVVYHSYYWTCQLYSHAGNLTPAFTVPAFGHDHYVRVAFDGNCASPSIGILPDTTPSSVTTAVPVVETSVGTSTGTEAPTTSSECPSNGRVGYFVVTAFELNEPQGVQPTVIDQTDDNFCSVSCTDNTRPDGTHTTCASFTFYPSENRCVISSGRGLPGGTDGSLASNTNAIYSQKFCMPADAPAICANDEVFLTFPKIQIDGFDLQQTNADSLEGCMQACIRSSPNCRSVVYTSGTNSCALKSSDLNENPDAGVPAADGVILAENGCLVNTAKVQTLALKASVLKASETEITDDLQQVDAVNENSEWSQWTPCQFEVGNSTVRVRTKKCDIYECLPGSLQVQKC